MNEKELTLIVANFCRAVCPECWASDNDGQLWFWITFRKSFEKFDINDLNHMHLAESVLRGSDEQYYNDAKTCNRWNRYSSYLFDHYSINPNGLERAQAFVQAINQFKKQ